MNQEQIVKGIELASHSGTTSDTQLHEPIPINALFISDIHLGYQGCMAPELVAFFNHVKPKYIYIVGDLVDCWSLNISRPSHLGRLFQTKSAKVQMRLPQGQSDILQKLLRFARNGTYLFYIPGNHDEIMRPSLSHMPDEPESKIDAQLAFTAAGKALTSKNGENPFSPFNKMFDQIAQIGNISCLPQIVHKTVDNRRFLVMHGDEFDFLIKNNRFLGILGTKVRDRLFSFSKWLARNDNWPVRLIMRRVFGLKPNFSLADYLHNFKSQADLTLPKLASAYIKNRNDIILQKQKTSDDWKNEPLYDGFIGGHNHIPAALKMNGVDYFNCGDWVGNGTALIEHLDGRMEMVRWDAKKGIVPLVKSVTPALVAPVPPQPPVTDLATPMLPPKPSSASCTVLVPG